MLPPRESNADIYNTNDGQPVLYHQQEPFYSVMWSWLDLYTRKVNWNEKKNEQSINNSESEIMW